MTKPDPIFELVPALPTATEKQLEQHKKNIRVYATGVARSGAQMFGYAFLAGNEMNAAAHLLPHGDLLPWIETNFPEITTRTANNWRQFAEGVKAKLETVSNLPKLTLLSSPTKPKTKFTEKECTALSTVVREAMDGKGMLEFMREAKFLRDIEDAGGFRPNAEKFQKWLKTLDEKTLSSLPPLPSVKFEDLPPKLQMQFKKWLASQNLIDKPNKKIELARTLLNDLTKQLVIAWRNKLQMHAGTPELQNEFEAAALNLQKLNAGFEDCAKAAKGRDDRAASSSKRKTKSDDAGADPTPSFSAYVNRWGALFVETYNFDNEIDWLKQPSISAVIRAVVGQSLEEATVEARRRYLAGACCITPAGELNGKPKLKN